MNSSSDSPIQILLVSNRENIRQAWRAALATTPNLDVVDECENGRDLIKQLARSDLDVVLVDVHTPHVQGQDMGSWVAETNPRVATVVFALCADAVTVFVTTRSGPDHTLITGVGMPRALEIIHAVALEKRSHRNVKIHD